MPSPKQRRVLEAIAAEKERDKRLFDEAGKKLWLGVAVLMIVEAILIWNPGGILS